MTIDPDAEIVAGLTSQQIWDTIENEYTTRLAYKRKRNEVYLSLSGNGSKNWVLTGEDPGVIEAEETMEEARAEYLHMLFLVRSLTDGSSMPAIPAPDKV